MDRRKWTITEGAVSKQGVCSVTNNQLQSLELSPELEEALLVKVRGVMMALSRSRARRSVYNHERALVTKS